MRPSARLAGAALAAVLAVASAQADEGRGTIAWPPAAWDDESGAVDGGATGWTTPGPVGSDVVIPSFLRNPYGPYQRPVVVDGAGARSDVPEPPTWAMMGLGLAGLGYACFHRARKSRPARYVL